MTLEDLQLVYKAFNLSPEYFQPPEPMCKLTRMMASSLKELQDMSKEEGKNTTDVYWLHRALILGMVVGTYADEDNNIADFCREVVRDKSIDLLTAKFLEAGFPSTRFLGFPIEALSLLTFEFTLERVLATVDFFIKEGIEDFNYLVKDVRGALENGGITKEASFYQAINES